MVTFKRESIEARQAAVAARRATALAGRVNFADYEVGRPFTEGEHIAVLLYAKEGTDSKGHNAVKTTFGIEGSSGGVKGFSNILSHEEVGIDDTEYEKRLNRMLEFIQAIDKSTYDAIISGEAKDLGDSYWKSLSSKRFGCVIKAWERKTNVDDTEVVEVVPSIRYFNNKAHGIKPTTAAGANTTTTAATDEEELPF